MRYCNKIRSLFIFLLLQFVFVKITLAQPGSGGISDLNNSQQFLADASGKPLNLRVEYNVQGTPFFPADYSLANLFMQNGKAYRGIKVKFNLNDNTLLYITSDNQEMILTTPVNKVVFTDTSLGGIVKDIVFENGFTSVDEQNNLTYYQVLDSGKVMLLKHTRVDYQDKKEYGSATITREFSPNDFWYLRLPDGSMKKVEKGKEAILLLLPSHKAEMSKFIDANNLKCRKESDWEKIIASYNSISSATN